MLKKISFLLEERLKKYSFLKRSSTNLSIKKYLRKNNFPNIKVKVLGKNINFYCPDHISINLLKQKEEDIKHLLGKDDLSFRYFLSAEND